MQMLRTAQAALGKGCLASSFICVYLFTGELYPTEIRWVRGGGPGSRLMPARLAEAGPSLCPALPLPPRTWHSQAFWGSRPLLLTRPLSSNRQMGMGFASVNARLGGLAAPLVTMLGEFSAVLPPMGFGATSILAGLAVCFLAETRNLPLLETIEAMERR